MRKWLRWEVFAVLGLVAIFAAKLGFGIQTFTTINGSMRPALGLYSWVITTESDDLAIGDIITFNTTQMGVVTHRIHNINPDGTFVTKGDANSAPDTWVLHRKDVIGKKVAVIPYIGAWFEKSFWVGRLKQPEVYGGILLMIAAFLVWRFVVAPPEQPAPAPQKHVGRHRQKPQKK